MDFGDGTPPVRLTFFGETSVRHTYTTAGSFDVRVAGEMPGADAARELVGYLQHRARGASELEARDHTMGLIEARRPGS